MSREAHADAFGRRQAIQFVPRNVDERFRVGDVEPNQLVKHHACQRALSEWAEGRERVADVADDRSPARHGLGDAAIDRVENLRRTRVRTLPAGGHHTANPGDKF